MHILQVSKEKQTKWRILASSTGNECYRPYSSFFLFLKILSTDFSLGKDFSLTALRGHRFCKCFYPGRLNMQGF